jgi:hypothetical protein
MFTDPFAFQEVADSRSTDHRLHRAVRVGRRSVDDEPVRRSGLQQPHAGRAQVNGTRTAFTLLIAAISLSAAVRAQGQRGGPPAAAAPAPKAAAPIDLTGYWVSIVSEDWRYRMVTPAKGDYQGVPMTPEAVKIADAWDPAADTSAGNQCRSYGAAAIMRVPGRVHITWQDDNTLRLETDAGTQVRTFRFAGSGGPTATQANGEPGWQGRSIAQWETPGAGRGGRGASPTFQEQGRFGVAPEPESRLPPEERSALQREREGDHTSTSPTAQRRTVAHRHRHRRGHEVFG